MVILVIYDIAETKNRNQVIKICEAEGLVRVQKSVFLGKIDKKYFEIMKRKLYIGIDCEKDCLFVLHMSQEQLQAAGIFGQSNMKAIIECWDTDYMII